MMKIKQKKFEYRLLSIIMVLILILAGCSVDNQKVSKEKKNIDIKLDEVINQQIKNSSDFILITENDRYCLYIKGTTAEIKVVDKELNTGWYSNPQNRDKDKFAVNLVSREKLISQIDIEYDNVSTKGQGVYSSYSDGINNNSVNYEKIENGLRVHYLVGKKPTIYLAPEILSIKRAEEIRVKLNEEDKEFFDTIYKKVSLNDFKSDADKALKKSNYPILAKRDVYIVQMQFKDPTGLGEQRFASTYLLKKINGMFERANYTIDDLNKDDKENESKQVHERDNTVSLCIEYKIDENGFVATIPQNYISFNKDNIQITKLSLLPYFGAAQDDKKGYIFVPDGSGALIYLNNDKKMFGSYQKKLYGIDRTISTETPIIGDEQLHIPVFGIKANDTAFIGIIEKGDAAAEICAEISGKTNQVNSSYAKFKINSSSKSVNSGLSAALGLRYQKELLKSDLQVRYVFLGGDKANYVNMALSYQKYLLNNKKITKQQIDSKIPLYISTVQSVIHKSAVLGIPIESPISLTTFNQTIKILDALKAKGTEKLYLQIKNWCNNSNLNEPFNKLNIINELGGIKDFKSLIQYTNDNGIKFYPLSDFQYVCRNGFNSSYDPKSDASKTLDNLIAYDYEFDLATNSKNKNTERTIVSPKKYGDFINSFINNYNSYNLKNLSLNSFGTDLCSDFSDTRTIDRQESAEIISQQMRNLSDKGYNLVVNGGNVYALNGASMIFNAPIVSSNENLFDETVPFFQIVLHGVLPYTVKPLNLSSDFETDVLKCIETGSIPSFEWIYENNDVLSETSVNMYNSYYKEWIDKAAQTYNKVNEALLGCGDSIITEHIRLSKDIVKVIYSNGTTIYINYGFNEVLIDNITINPRCFKALKGVDKQ